MNRTAVEEIKARIPIEELIGSYIKIEKSGRALKARCPFHNEKTPSFFISPERGGYYCFGCGAKGDIFSFVEQFEGLDFKGALKVLAERAGVPLVFENKGNNERDQLFEIMEVATRYFQSNLSKSKDSLAYLKKRGLKEETIQAFRIGWAPLGWQNLHEHLNKIGWKDALIEKAGLIKRSDQNDSGQASLYDRFRGRIIFPITDSSGRVVAFTGRILIDDGKSAKYLNSPETPIFIKSDILFGLDKAKSEIRRLNYSILVEGQMDLILSHQAGLKNTIAASGTALTDNPNGQNGMVSNLGLVRRLSQNMIIALDSDKAGKTATMRAVVATAIGLGMSVKIADSTSLGLAGKDPADIILDNPENWKNVLKNAKHVIEFELGNIIKEINDHHKLAQAVRDRIFPFLSKMDSAMDKAYYIKIIAEKAGFSEQSVSEDLKKYESKATNQVQKSEVNHNVPTSNTTSRKDLVHRRLFGLLNLLEKNNKNLTTDYREKIKNIAGEKYFELINLVETNIDEINLEAEIYYGSEPDKIEYHIKDLLKNFELDFINEELMLSMSLLRQAEKSNDHKAVAELAKKCQVLSIRKSELARM